MDTIPGVLREMFEVVGHTPKSAAKASGVSKRAIENWLSGAHHPATLVALFRVADSIGMAIAKPALRDAFAAGVQS